MPITMQAKKSLTPSDQDEWVATQKKANWTRRDGDGKSDCHWIMDIQFWLQTFPLTQPPILQQINMIIII